MGKPSLVTYRRNTTQPRKKNDSKPLSDTDKPHVPHSQDANEQRSGGHSVQVARAGVD